MTSAQHLTSEQAREIQGAFDALAGDLDRMDPDSHARLVAQISPELAQALQAPALRSLADFYDERNTAAKSAQGWHFFSGRWAAVATAGAVLATLPLVFVEDEDAWEALLAGAVALQGVFVLLAGAFSLYIYARRPRVRWLAARSDAEAARRLYYKTVAELSLPLPTPQSLTLRLEFFRRFQMDTQRAYYSWKQPAARKQANRARRAYIAGLTISAIAATPALLKSASMLIGAQPRSVAPEVGTTLSRALDLVAEGPYFFAGCGVFATALLGLVAALAALDTSRRNADSYQENLRRLDNIAENDLAPAREAALAGDEAGTATFINLVDKALAAEQGEWSVIGRSRENG